MNFKDATQEEIDKALDKAWKAFHQYRLLSLKQRAGFMREIAVELENLGDTLITTAVKETNLPDGRLKGERARTIFQLNSYAQAAEEGSWLEARMDTADPDRNPPRVDIRKMLVPMGPVVVFGASNFPFAFSTAGGDTACAFAAGCPVIVKAHPAHAATSEMVAGAIIKAARSTGMPDGIFAHIHGAGTETGRALVQHRYTKAVAFTGSLQGGKALFEWGNQRKEPIPVFAEMGSINPVFLLPQKLKEDILKIAEMYAASITQGVGQFCTNPGLIIGIESEELHAFINELGNQVRKVRPEKMLHPGIASMYLQKKSMALEQPGVEEIAIAPQAAEEENTGRAAIASATGKAYLENPLLHQEVFGPYSLVIRCKDIKEMTEVARRTEGQLTATLMATVDDIQPNGELLETIKDICGRLLMNGVPTGVEVCLSMQHGGPYPATTDSRFTSVGADGIKRFARPVCFQNWPDTLLPDALKNNNPLGIWRTVNNELTKK